MTARAEVTISSRYFRDTTLAIVWVLFCATGFRAADSVVVESVTVPAGATEVQVGAYVENNEAVSAQVRPLEIREIDAGAYVSGSLPEFMVFLQEGLA